MMAIKQNPEERESTDSRSQPRHFVGDLQRLLKEGANASGFHSALNAAADRLRGQLFSKSPADSARLGLRVDSDVPNAEPAIRTRRPTRTLVTVDMPERVDTEGLAERVDLFLTTHGLGGTVQTRQVGSAKYPDTDGKWRVEFVTGRVAAPTGRWWRMLPLPGLRGRQRSSGRAVLHAEVVGLNGALLAIDAIGLVD